MKKIITLIIVSLFLFNGCEKKEEVIQLEINTKVINDVYEELKLNIEAEYPQINISGNSLVELTINSTIEEYVTGLIKEFKDQVILNDFVLEEFSNAFDLNSEILFKGENILSIRFDNYTYFAGAAHGLSIASVMNFDLNTGYKIELRDKFTDDNYLEIISQICIEDLKRQLTTEEYEPDLEWIESGAGPDLINYQVYAFLEKELLIVFNQYQVAPYVFGLLEVKIPYEKLGNNIKRESIK